MVIFRMKPNQIQTSNVENLNTGSYRGTQLPLCLLHPYFGLIFLYPGQSNLSYKGVVILQNASDSQTPSLQSRQHKMPVPPDRPMMYFPTEKPYVDLDITSNDIKSLSSLFALPIHASNVNLCLVASLAFGWTLGFGYFTACHCVRETRRTRRINTYVILIWGELVV